MSGRGTSFSEVFRELSVVEDRVTAIEDGPEEQYLSGMTQLVEELMRNGATLEFAKFALERMDGHIGGAGMSLYRIVIPSESSLQKKFPAGSPEDVSQILWRKLSARMRG
jgi:hypothetical protein